MRSIILAGAVTVVASGAAWGAEVTTYQIDFAPTVQMLLDYAIAVLTGVLAWVLARYVGPALQEHLGEQAAQVARDGLDQIVRRGIRIAADKLDVAHHVEAVEVKNELLAEAAGYVASAAPGWVAKFGLTPERIELMVRARLGEELSEIQFQRGAEVVSEPAP